MKVVIFSFLVFAIFSSYTWGEDNVFNGSSEEMFEILSHENGFWSTNPWVVIGEYGLSFQKNKTLWLRGPRPYDNSTTNYKIIAPYITINNYGGNRDLLNGGEDLTFTLVRQTDSIFGEWRLESRPTKNDKRIFKYYSMNSTTNNLCKTAIYERFLIQLGDHPPSFDKFSSYFDKPHFNASIEKIPVRLLEKGMESKFYFFSIGHGEQYEENAYKYSISFIGSTFIENTKWYLVSYMCDADIINRYGKLLWTKNTPSDYPKTVFDYYIAISKKEIEKAYSLSSKAISLDQFKELYNDTKYVISINFKIISENICRGYVLLKTIDDVYKIYSVEFNLEKGKIKSSYSREISEKDLPEEYKGIVKK